MADCSLPSSLPSQPKHADLSPQEVEHFARILRNRHQGFLPSCSDCDLLLEIILRYTGGAR